MRRTQVITPSLITFAAMISSVIIPVEEEEQKKSIGIRPQNLNPHYAPKRNTGCGSVGCRKLERCLCDCRKCRASCKMSPQHYTETRKLPCCGVEIPWDPVWFAHLKRVTNGELTEESVLDSLRSKHVCPKSSNEKDEAPKTPV